MIYYFSCTGNTRWAARQLAEATGEELVWIPDAQKQHHRVELKQGERIGFCFPVHGWRPPKNVREFCRNLCISNPEGHYAFALCTAGDNIGETMRLLKEDLYSCGIKLQALCSLVMPESYIGLPFMDVDKPEKEKSKIAQSQRVLNRFIQSVVERKAYSNLVVGNWPRINTRLIGSYFLNKLVTDKHFRVDADKCIGCGKCQQVCPTGNMGLGNDRLPHWSHDGSCLTCFACYHYCPQRAIAFGHRTDGKGQYYFQRSNKV